MPHRKPGENAISHCFVFHQRIENELIETSVEIAATVEQGIGSREHFTQLRFVRCTNFCDEFAHRFVCLEQIREYRQELVSEVGNLALFHVEIEHAEKLTV